MTRGRTAQAALERQKTRQAQIQGDVDKRDKKLKSSAAVHYKVGTWVYIQVPKVDQSALGGRLLMSAKSLWKLHFKLFGRLRAPPRFLQSHS